jgi:cell division protein FtsL
MSAEPFAHTLKRREWRPTTQVAALGTLALFVAIIIGALYLTQSSTTSQIGRQLEDLIVRRNNLEQQNERLRAEIASLRSIVRLRTRAEDLGFRPATNSEIRYVVVEGYHPERELAVSDDPFAQAPAALLVALAEPEYEESFLGWVQQQFDAFTSQSAAPSDDTP